MCIAVYSINFSLKFQVSILSCFIIFRRSVSLHMEETDKHDTQAAGVVQVSQEDSHFSLVIPVVNRSLIHRDSKCIKDRTRV